MLNIKIRFLVTSTDLNPINCVICFDGEEF